MPRCHICRRHESNEDYTDNRALSTESAGPLGWISAYELSAYSCFSANYRSARFSRQNKASRNSIWHNIMLPLHTLPNQLLKMVRATFKAPYFLVRDAESSWRRHMEPAPGSTFRSLTRSKYIQRINTILKATKKDAPVSRATVFVSDCHSQFVPGPRACLVSALGPPWGGYSLSGWPRIWDSDYTALNQ